MKRIIEGKTYNTETATCIATWFENTSGLWVTRGGAFFKSNLDPKTEEGDLSPVTREEAEQWARGELLPVELLNTDIFAEPPEAADDTDPEATIYLRVPLPLKRQIEDEASKASQSVNAWAMKCMESCLDKLRQEQAEADRLNTEIR